MQKRPINCSALVGGCKLQIKISIRDKYGRQSWCRLLDGLNTVKETNIRGRPKGLTKQMLADDSIGGLVLIIAYKHTV